MIEIGIVAVTIGGVVYLNHKEVVHIDSNMIQIISYGGFGAMGIYVMYQLGKLFLLF